MVLKKLARLCARQGMLLLCDRADGTQWAGTSAALYALNGLPTLGLGSLCVMLDIPPEKAAEMITRHMSFPEAYETEESAAARQLFFDMDDSICYHGANMLPCGDEEELFFIDPEILKPLSDCEALRLHARSRGKTPYIVAYDGLFPVAVLMPRKMGSELTDWLISSAKLAAETREKYKWA